MSDTIDSKCGLASSISELESLGLETSKVNELNDSYEVENLVDNLKQMLYVEYKSMPFFTDWQFIGCPLNSRYLGVHIAVLTVKYHNIQYWVLGNGIILIVNDDTDLAELFAAALNTGGFKTTVTDNASLAMAQIINNPNEYSLVLIDRSSQQDSDFPKQIKRINDQIKVLLVSGFSFTDAEKSKSPYVRILQLPITMSNLVSTVREVLGSNA
jgi:CheY-like chemotaxis protein